MIRLPPFDALVAFEATLRLEGMTRAAEELGLTQSAVSHRLRRLEDFMGVDLLVRRNTKVEASLAGLALLEALKPLLDGAAELRDRVRDAAAPERLRVGVGAALADHWLVRRLPEFTAAHPDLTIELVVVENEAPERTADLDVRILWRSAEEARANSTQRPLFRENVFPVASPALLPRGFESGDAEVLARLPLLHKRTPGYQAGAEWSWESWFERFGLDGRPKEALRFTAIGPLVAAALEGAGAGLVRSMLVADALAAGRLVRLLPPEADLPSQKVHVVRWPGRLIGDRRVRAFVDWLAATADLTDAAPVVRKLEPAAGG
jgi:LysR family transcriptional regulator, glycine cleavage system transcriptional activator